MLSRAVAAGKLLFVCYSSGFIAERGVSASSDLLVCHPFG